MRSERVDERNIRCVAASRDNDPANPRHIVARIECPPRAVEEHFDPGAEIHRIDHGHANIAKMAVDVARRNVEAAAQRHREMGEISANAYSLVERLERSSGRSRLQIVELDVLMDKIANRLHASPPRRDGAEHIPSSLAQLVRFAISAPHEVEQALVGQVRDGNLSCAK